MTRAGAASVLVLLCLLRPLSSLKTMDVVHQWKHIDFEFPDERTRNESINKREFVPGNAVPLDVDVWINGPSRKIFLAFPKFKDGIPATLATVSERRDSDAPLLEPYPDWTWHRNRNCDGLTSVFRTQIDKCGRLWAIDSGMVDLSSGQSRRLCQPQLVAFILRTTQVAGIHKFEDHLLKEGSILANLAVDVRGGSDSCHDTFVYVADVTSYALLVFDARNNKSWKIQSNTMYPYPPYGVFCANNAEFDLMDGILGMALGPMKRGDRTLYYHSLASVRESWVPTSVLRNERNFASGQNNVPRQFQSSPEARKSQSIAEAFDKNGILYFGMMDDNSINCWNSETAFVSSNIHQLEQDNRNLQFAAGMKVITNEKGEEELWAMTDRFQLLMTGGMKMNEVNFRVVSGKVEDLLRNSPCRKYKNIVFPNKTDASEGSKLPSGHHDKPSSGYYG